MGPKEIRFNLDNSSRRRKNNTPDLVDRIGALPDSILGLILSYLPTKNAVATAILSKRWKFVWMTVHNLDFCYEHRSGEDNDMKFIRFVNRVLLLHGGRLLNKFRLVWKYVRIHSEVSSWMSTTDTRNVHELFICVENPWGRMPEPLEMPISLFRCDSLQSLELDRSIYVSASIVVSLPRLESLKLVAVHFHSEETFQKLISGCPMLKYLHIDLNINEFTEHFEEDDVFTYRISSPSLRRLHLSDGLWDFNLIRRLELEASSLEYLKIIGPISQVFVQGSLSSIVEADFGILLQEYYEDIYDSLAKGVRSFDCAKALTLSADVMWALTNATISLSTKFKRLTKLVAGVVCCYCSSLLDFIQRSDCLEDLTVYKQAYDIAEYMHDHSHSNWTAAVEVPRCLSNSLKMVTFDNYAGLDDEREMIGYMLKHGSTLEVMQVTCDKYNLKGKKIELVKEICRFPKKSPACKVEFIE